MKQVRQEPYLWARQPRVPAVIFILLLAIISACTTGINQAPQLEDELHAASGATVRVRVAASLDDVAERETGHISEAAHRIELSRNNWHGEQILGFRFTSLQIPKGATITNAYIQFTADQVSDEPTSLTIQGQAEGNTETFSPAKWDLSSRPTTVAEVTWSPAPWESIGDAGAAQRTPNLASVVQEIVHLPDWASGNAMVFFVTGTGQRFISTYDRDPSVAPLLHVEYSLGGGTPPPPAEEEPPPPADEPPPVNPGPSPYDHLVQLHVNVNTGSDSNAGTSSAPIKTLNEGLNRALENRRRGQGTRILLHPGTYRESIDGYYSHSRGPLIVIEALETGKAVISGSDIFNNWSCSGSMCTHRWTQKWGRTPNPWSRVTVQPLGLRREMIFVNGSRLEQRLSLSEVQHLPGSFYIDEASERVHMHLPRGVSIGSATVEAGMRPRLFWAQTLHDLVLKGIVFQHATTPLSKAAVYIIEQNNVLLEDLTVQYNNSDGLGLSRSNNITVLNSKMSHNGTSGMGAWRVRRVLVEDSETSYNNWRGDAGGVHNWAIGQKFMLTRDLTIRRHTSTNNLSRGLWIDWDNENTVIDDVLISNNLLDGLFVEASQGPVTVRNSTIRDNGRAGLLTSAMHNFTFENNVVSGNMNHQFFLSGSFDVRVANHVTGQVHTLNNQNWQWRNNRVSTKGNSLLFFTTIPVDRWNSLLSSWQLNNNSYTAEQARAFQPSGIAPVDFSSWRQRTNKDSNSSFNR